MRTEGLLSFEEMKEKIKELRDKGEIELPGIRMRFGFHKKEEIYLNLLELYPEEKKTEYFCAAKDLEEAREEIRKMGFTVCVKARDKGGLIIMETWLPEI